MSDLTQARSATPRRLCDIATEIRADWRKPYFGAVPYIDALSTLNTMHDKYICEKRDRWNWLVGDGKSMMLDFLANASTWRGEVARRVKTELRGMLAREVSER